MRCLCSCYIKEGAGPHKQKFCPALGEVCSQGEEGSTLSPLPLVEGQVTSARAEEHHGAASASLLLPSISTNALIQTGPQPSSRGWQSCFLF